MKDGNRLTGAWWGRHLVVPALLVSISNLPFWIMGANHLVMLRPVFNVDVIAALLIGSVAPLGGALALFVLWCVDALQSASLIYRFSSPEEFLASFRSANELKLAELITAQTIVFAIPFIAALGGLFWLLQHGRPISKGGLIALACLLTVVDSVNGSAPIISQFRDTYIIQTNLSGSPTANLASGEIRRFLAPPQALRPFPTAPSQVDAIAWAQAHRGKNVLMVVVESLGEQNNRVMQAWLDRQLFSDTVAARWAASKSLVPFRGATTDGELRSLCQQAGQYGSMTEASAESCLPNKFSKIEYDSVGMHGFTSDMFSRGTWWKTMGLTRALFAEDFPGAPQCGGVFTGLCDSFLVEQAGRELRTPRRFVYLLTLNTHLPLTRIELPKELEALCVQEMASNSHCQLVGQHSALFAHLSAMLLDLPSAPLVIVVGDHAPPFFVSRDRTQYRQDVVPQYVLEPR